MEEQGLKEVKRIIPNATIMNGLRQKKNGRKGVCAANDQNNRNSYEGKEIEKGNENEFVKKITITLVIIIYAQSLKGLKKLSLCRRELNSSSNNEWLEIEEYEK